MTACILRAMAGFALLDQQMLQEAVVRFEKLDTHECASNMDP